MYSRPDFNIMPYGSLKLCSLYCWSLDFLDPWAEQGCCAFIPGATGQLEATCVRARPREWSPGVSSYIILSKSLPHCFPRSQLCLRATRADMRPFAHHGICFAVTKQGNCSLNTQQMNAPLLDPRHTPFLSVRAACVFPLSAIERREAPGLWLGTGALVFYLFYRQKREREKWDLSSAPPRILKMFCHLNTT